MPYSEGVRMRESMTAKFRLLLLGRYQLIGPAGPIDLTSKKLAGLLAFLAFTSPVP